MSKSKLDIMGGGGGCVASGSHPSDLSVTPHCVDKMLPGLGQKVKESIIFS